MKEKYASPCCDVEYFARVDVLTTSTETTTQTDDNFVEFGD